MMIYDVYIISLIIHTCTARKSRKAVLIFIKIQCNVFALRLLLVVNGKTMKKLTICEPLLHGGIFEHCWLSETSARKICIGIDALEGSNHATFLAMVAS